MEGIEYIIKINNNVNQKKNKIIYWRIYIQDFVGYKYLLVAQQKSVGHNYLTGNSTEPITNITHSDFQKYRNSNYQFN